MRLSFLILNLFLFSALDSNLYARETDCKLTKKENIQAFLSKSLSPEQINNNWECLFTEQNYRKDSNKTNSRFENIFPIADDLTYEINGKINYYGVFPKNYKYTVKLNARENKVEIILNLFMFASKKLLKRIDICNSDSLSLSNKYKEKTINRIKKHCTFGEDEKSYLPLNEMWKKVDKNIQEAEDLWNSSAPSNIKFTFKRVGSRAKSHYQIKLVDRFGALYDSFLYYRFGSDVYAHEIGHMLGLDEEYAVVTSNIIPYHQLKNDLFHKGEDFETTGTKDMRCNLESIMCLRETIYPYHYNNILRRIPKQ